MRLWQLEWNYKVTVTIALVLILTAVYHQSPYNLLEPTPSGEFSRFFPQPSDWLNKSVEEMSESEMLKYLHWADRGSCFLSYDFGGRKLVANQRTGIDGQKTICMDKGVAPEPGKCLIYSVGISNEWSFDDAMDDYGCQVFAFDPSMGVKSHNRSSRVHFYNLGLGPKDTDLGPNGWRMRTLSTIYQTLKRIHGDVPIDVLKVDIEDNEWEVLPQIIQSGLLDKVKQIAMEVHYFMGGNSVDVDKMRNKMKIIKLLEQSGMIRFAIRPNPFLVTEIIGENDYALYELAWFNSKYKDPNPIS